MAKPIGRSGMRPKRIVSPPCGSPRLRMNMSRPMNPHATDATRKMPMTASMLVPPRGRPR